jgi:Polysaccharide lyase
VLWYADPALSPARVFDGLERAPGAITVADDPQGRYGRSFKFETWDHDGGKERCESRGLRRPDGSVLRINSSMEGQTLYIGWRSLWNPMPSAKGRWLALFQLHISGRKSGELGAGPYVLRTLGDGQLHFQYTPPNGDDRHIWSTPLSLNTWNTFVIGFRLSRSSSAGWTEFWYNGVQQRFANGSTRYPGVTLMGTHVNFKWGVYRSGPNRGRAAAPLNQARLGTSYADVAPSVELG